MNSENKIKIVEVGPRDGLQNETINIPTDVKFRFIKNLVDAGLTDIEVSSFVHPEKIPQLRDAERLFKIINEKVKKDTYGVLSNKKVKWALSNKKSLKEVFKVGDIIFVKKNKNSWNLKQYPKVDGGIVALDPYTGDVKALVGGFNFRFSGFLLFRFLDSFYLVVLLSFTNKRWRSIFEVSPESLFSHRGLLIENLRIDTSDNA